MSAISTTTLVEAFITTLVIVSAMSTFSMALTNEFKSKMTDIQAQRIDNAAMALSATPNSSIEIDMKGYSVNYKNNIINVSFKDSYSGVEFGTTKYGYAEVRAPRDPTKINNTLCVSRLPYSTGLNTGTSGGVGTQWDYRLSIQPGECA